MIKKIGILSSVAVIGFIPNVYFGAKVFLAPKTRIYKIDSKDFFLLMSSKENQIGNINNNGKLGFRSSWGVWNNAESNGEFKFNISKKIYNTIMTNPINISSNTIDFTSQNNVNLNIQGKLFGEANATSIWGDYSEMYLDEVLTAINGEVEIETTI